MKSLNYKRKRCFSFYKHNILHSFQWISGHPRPISSEHESWTSASFFWWRDTGPLSSGKLAFRSATRRHQRSRSVVYMCSTSFSMQLRHGGDTVAFNPQLRLWLVQGPLRGDRCSNSNLSVKSGPWEKKKRSLILHKPLEPGLRTLSGHTSRGGSQTETSLPPISPSLKKTTTRTSSVAPPIMSLGSPHFHLVLDLQARDLYTGMGGGPSASTLCVLPAKLDPEEADSQWSATCTHARAHHTCPKHGTRDEHM